MTTPPTPQPSHLDIETLADLQEGLLDSEQVTTVAGHLDSCAGCRAQSEALDGVRATLRAVGADAEVATPEDVVRRLDDALAATAAVPAAPVGVVTASATVTPLTAATARTRQPWKTRLLQAAAVFVLVAAVGGLGYGGIRAIGGGSSGAANSASGGGDAAATEKSAAGAGRYSITSSGRDYTSTSLRSAVPGLLSEAAADSGTTGADGPSPTSSASTKTPVPAQALANDPNRLQDGTALAECVANLAGGPVTPLAVDIGRFEGKPATIIVLPDPDDASFVNAYAVAPDCPTGTFLAWEHVVLP
jgi:hypothetical protein